MKHLPAIARDPATTRIFFETQAGNRCVVHVAKKLPVVPAGERPNSLAPAITMVQYATTR